VACPNEDTALLFVRGQLAAAEARQVELHVDGCERCYATLTELARAFGSVLTVRSALGHESGVRHRTEHTAAPEVRSPAALEIGGRFGRYTIQGQIGEGGMGRVYVAYDTVLSRPVALKLIRPNAIASASMEEATLREARAIAQLSHPNVVAVYDAGVEGGQIYIAMEYVPGVSLAVWLAQGARSPGEVHGVLRQAALGLWALHSAGLVHRDVKPDNILVGADGRVRITDFGLAQFGAGGDGLFAGTPAYMAPEQLFARPVDPRADQFAFATVICEALTRQRPYGGRTLDELKWSIAQGRPVFPPSLPPPVRDVLSRALALDPARRFPTLRAFAVALEDALDARHGLHFKLNVTFLVVMTLIHAALTIWYLAGSDIPRSPSSPSTSSGSSEPDWWIPIGVVTVLIIGLTVLVWVPLGIVWAPINAWGIVTRKRWARASTIIYAVFGLITCVGTPYSAYALISLRRPDVKRAFEPEA
jgi:serine/threonine protein kinase